MKNEVDWSGLGLDGNCLKTGNRHPETFPTTLIFTRTIFDLFSFPSEAAAPQQPMHPAQDAHPDPPPMVAVPGIEPADYHADDADPADEPPAPAHFNVVHQQPPPAAFQAAADGAVVYPAGRGLEGLIRIVEERGEPKFLLMGVPQHKPLPGERFD